MLALQQLYSHREPFSASPNECKHAIRPDAIDEEGHVTHYECKHCGVLFDHHAINEMFDVFRARIAELEAQLAASTSEPAQGA